MLNMISPPFRPRSFDDQLGCSVIIPPFFEGKADNGVMFQRVKSMDKIEIIIPGVLFGQNLPRIYR